MRRIILGFIAAVLATLTLTGVQATTSTAQASSACNVGTAPQGNLGSYGSYLRINGVLYRSSCVAWSATRTGSSVRVLGAIKDTATDGCKSMFAFRFNVYGNWSKWTFYSTANEGRWSKFDKTHALTGVPTSIEVVAFRSCLGVYSSYGDQLSYSFR